jgi:hypothetical protein
MGDYSNMRRSISCVACLALLAGIARAVAGATLTVSGSADTFVTDHPSLGGTSSTHGSDATLYEIGTPGFQATPLFLFNLSGYAGQSVVGNGTLQLYVSGDGYAPATQTISVCNELNSWNPATTNWNNLTGPFGTTGSTLDTETVTCDGGANPARYVTWTIPASTLQSWINSPTSNDGLVLVSQTTAYFQDLTFSSISGGNPPLLNFATLASSGAIAWSNFGTAWNVTSNWTGGVPGSLNVALFGLGGYTYQPILTTTASIGALWNTGGGSMAITGTTLTINSATVNGNADMGIEMDPGAGSLTISAPLNLAAPQTWLNNSTAPLTLAGNVANNGNALTIAGSGSTTISGNLTGGGGLAEIGSGTFTLGGADTFSALGGIAISQGTLAAPYGISHSGSAVTVSAGATLLAGGQINRAVSGNGTITATGELIIGNATLRGQFNQGGAPGVGGTLNAVVILSAGTAVLGSQTNITADGSLTAIGGIQLGNSASVDATKVLTATGAATINGNFINNGIVNGPTGAGAELTFTQFVKGAGSTTGNVEYQASYLPSNSPNAVSVQNVLLDSTSTLIMELAGDVPGSGYDQLDISGLATLNGTLDVELLNGFTLSAGDYFDIFDGSTTGSFTQIDLPALTGGMSWNTADLYSTGTISVVPEPSTLALLVTGAISMLGYGLWRRSTAEKTLPTALSRATRHGIFEKGGICSTS